MDKWLDLKQQELVKYSVRICVCVCMCASHRVWLWGRARCCFGTCSPENKRLGSLRPHQLPSTLGQWRENQITCDHKHSPNKCNAVMWGCCWKMTDVGGRPEPCQEYIKKNKTQSAEENERRQNTFLQNEHAGNDNLPSRPHLKIRRERKKDGEKDAEIMREKVNYALHHHQTPMFHFHVFITNNDFWICIPNAEWVFYFLSGSCLPHYIQRVKVRFSSPLEFLPHQ